MNKDRWVECLKATLAKAKEKGVALKPSSDVVCMASTFKYIVDGIADDMGRDKMDENEKAFVTTLQDSLNELLASAQKEGCYGLASNASAAAKAAGFKAQSLDYLLEL